MKRTNESSNVWNYRDEIFNPTEQIINAVFNISNIIGILQNFINTGMIDNKCKISYDSDIHNITISEMITSLKKSTSEIANGTSKLRELVHHIDNMNPNKNVKLTDVERIVNFLMNK